MTVSTPIAVLPLTEELLREIRARIVEAFAPERVILCAFHCQQAAEKFLKAYLVCHQIEFRKTHDLDQLLRLASQAEPALQEELASCGWPAPFGVEFRYPGDYPKVDRIIAQNVLAEAKRVRQVIVEYLAPYLSGEEH